MAEITDLDDIIELVSVGEDTPPAAHGSRGQAHITGPAPTGKWEGNPNALALDSGDGSFTFKDAAEMKKHIFFWQDALQTWDGSALAPLTGGGGGEPPAAELPEAPTTDGTYRLGLVVTGGVAGAPTWELEAPVAGRSGSGPTLGGNPSGGAPGGNRPPSSSTGPKGPSGGAGGGRLDPEAPRGGSPGRGTGGR